MKMRFTSPTSIYGTCFFIIIERITNLMHLYQLPTENFGFRILIFEEIPGHREIGGTDGLQ